MCVYMDKFDAKKIIIFVLPKTQHSISILKQSFTT